MAVTGGPGASGEIPIQPETILATDSEGYTLRGDQRLPFRHPDPEAPNTELGVSPIAPLTYP